MPHAILDRVRVVLVATSHPGNIGAAARAMKTMGLARLVLVRPRGFPCAEASARAAGADDLLYSARLCDTLAEAVGDCTWVVGSSARARQLGWGKLEPREFADGVVAQAARGEVAVVFGRERSGLSNVELDLCHARVAIPTALAFSSLNLGAAVQVLAYELRQAVLAAGSAVATSGDAAERPASAAELEGFYTHLRDTVTEIGYLDPDSPKLLMRRLRRLFNRAQPEHAEINILRGILTAVHKARGRD